MGGLYGLAPWGKSQDPSGVDVRSYRDNLRVSGIDAVYSFDAAGRRKRGGDYGPDLDRIYLPGRV